MNPNLRMIADRKTVAENYGRHTLGFTEVEDQEYCDLVLLIERLHSIRRGFIFFGGIGADEENYRKDVVLNLLAHGREFFVGDRKKGRRPEGMVSQECHDNVKKLIVCFPHLRHIRGWALYHGDWQSHSWALDPATGQFIETTPIRWTHYFGRDITEEMSTFIGGK